MPPGSESRRPRKGAGVTLLPRESILAHEFLARIATCRETHGRLDQTEASGQG